jgi:hypothetical protein
VRRDGGLEAAALLLQPWDALDPPEPPLTWVSELYHVVVRSFCPGSPLTFGIYSSWSCDNFQNGWPGAKYLYHLMERKAYCQHCIFVAFSLFQFGFDFVAVYGFQEIVAFWLSLATSM